MPFGDIFVDNSLPATIVACFTQRLISCGKSTDRKVKDMNALEELFGRIFADNLPPLPPAVREWVVKILPWIIIVLGALGLLAWLAAVGLFGHGQMAALSFHRYAPSIFAAIILYLFVPLLQLLGIAGGYFMLGRKRIGWRIAFYSLILGLVIHILSISLGGIIVNLIFAYLLFQIRPYYRET